MINKKKFLVILVLGLFLSCGDEEGWTSYYGSVYFSFKEKVTTIEIDEHVKSFKLHGIIVENPDMDSYNDPYEMLATRIWIDTVRTTARHRVHFINNVNKYKQGEGSNVYTEFELIPENITSEVQIVYISPFRQSKDGLSKDTTTIILTPRNKE